MTEEMPLYRRLYLLIYRGNERERENASLNLCRSFDERHLNAEKTIAEWGISGKV